jgi:hypothetical protein
MNNSFEVYDAAAPSRHAVDARGQAADDHSELYIRSLRFLAGDRPTVFDRIYCTDSTLKCPITSDAFPRNPAGPESISAREYIV